MIKSYLTKKRIEKTIFICINLNKEEPYNRVRLDLIQTFLGFGTCVSFTLTSLTTLSAKAHGCVIIPK